MEVAYRVSLLLCEEAGIGGERDVEKDGEHGAVERIVICGVKCTSNRDKVDDLSTAITYPPLAATT